MAMESEIRCVEHLLEDFDAICRHGFQVYRGYAPEVLIEHDARAAASCTYAHMLAEADRRLPFRSHVVPHDINGLKVWLVGPDAVIRLKRMDEDGKTRSYPTTQARAFDAGKTLPGLPAPAARFTVGYWLDPTQTQYIRTQIAKPRGRLIPEWCAAIITDERGRKSWVDVTRQKGLGG